MRRRRHSALQSPYTDAFCMMIEALEADHLHQERRRVDGKLTFQHALDMKVWLEIGW